MPACTRRITVLVASTVTCRTGCRNIRHRRSTNAAAIKRMNENREGSFLDFLEDFTNRFPDLRRRVQKRYSLTIASGSSGQSASVS